MNLISQVCFSQLCFLTLLSSFKMYKTYNIVNKALLQVGTRFFFSTSYLVTTIIRTLLGSLMRLKIFSPVLVHCIGYKTSSVQSLVILKVFHPS